MISIFGHHFLINNETKKARAKKRGDGGVGGGSCVPARTHNKTFDWRCCACGRAVGGT